jgi:hypothetical protein
MVVEHFCRSRFWGARIQGDSCFVRYQIDYSHSLKVLGHSIINVHSLSYFNYDICLCVLTRSISKVSVL